MLVPPAPLRLLIHKQLRELLERNPAATSSESYVQHHAEFALMVEAVVPRYLIRIGINYHGAKVQHLQLSRSGTLVGWNPGGDALGTGPRAKMLLAGHTIFDRRPGEQLMSDCKVGGGSVPAGEFVRCEFKVRGWLGKTKNLDGAQLQKDFQLLENDRADLLVIALSEVAHRKWRGEGPTHQVARRAGLADFARVLVDPAAISGTGLLTRRLAWNAAQQWETSTQRVVGGPGSTMPGAEHYVTLCWRVT